MFDIFIVVYRTVCVRLWTWEAIGNWKVWNIARIQIIQYLKIYSLL